MVWKSSILFGFSSVVSSPAPVMGSVASRWRARDGVDELGTTAAVGVPARVLVEDGKAELPATANCSMLRPSQEALEFFIRRKRVVIKLLTPLMRIYTGEVKN